MKTEYKKEVETVIKGVNKQIIEIKCTNNEYFERALLFVDSDCDIFSEDVSESAARDFIDEIMKGITDNQNGHLLDRRRHSRKMLEVLACVLAFLSLFAVIVLAKLIYFA